MEDYKHVSTPMVIGCKLRKDDESKEYDKIVYILIIGSLHYATASMPYAMQEVG
jgi:hypothetical protein